MKTDHIEEVIDSLVEFKRGHVSACRPYWVFERFCCYMEILDAGFCQYFVLKEQNTGKNLVGSLAGSSRIRFTGIYTRAARFVCCFILRVCCIFVRCTSPVEDRSPRLWSSAGPMQQRKAQLQMAALQGGARTIVTHFFFVTLVPPIHSIL